MTKEKFYENRKLFLVLISITLIAFIILLFYFYNTREIYYQITFDTNGGNIIAPRAVKKEGLITLPPDPTKEGYEFIGWFSDDVRIDEYVKITEDITLIANWRTMDDPEDLPNTEDKEYIEPTAMTNCDIHNTDSISYTYNESLNKCVATTESNLGVYACEANTDYKNKYVNINGNVCYKIAIGDYNKDNCTNNFGNTKWDDNLGICYDYNPSSSNYLGVVGCPENTTLVAGSCQPVKDPGPLCPDTHPNIEDNTCFKNITEE